MAYSGSTAATTLQNPPVVAYAFGLSPYSNVNNAVVSSTASPLFGGNRLWHYASTDSSTLVQNTGYFTDGGTLGMRNGDVLFNIGATSVGSTSVTLQIGILMTTTTAGSSNLSPINFAAFGLTTGGAITSTFN